MQFIKFHILDILFFIKHEGFIFASKIKILYIKIQNPK